MEGLSGVVTPYRLPGVGILGTRYGDSGAVGEVVVAVLGLTRRALFVVGVHALQRTILHGACDVGAEARRARLAKPCFFDHTIGGAGLFSETI